MRLKSVFVGLGAVSLPSVTAWGSLGHITVAYVATEFVQPETAAYFQGLLRNDTADYLAGVATWADSIRYTKWGRFTKNFHFIDAKDDPPRYCGVDLARDCKSDGCVVTSIQNYTSQVLGDYHDDDDGLLPDWRRAQAAKFVIHFVGDIHQPLHAENVERGGNGIYVRLDGRELNLHHVWDTAIAEKFVGGHARRRPYDAARAWAGDLADQIRGGRYAAPSRAWTDGIDLDDPIATAMVWANESNALVCSNVFPEGPEAIVGQELGGEYYEKAAPVIELQVAKAGYRLAAWLDLIVERLSSSHPPSEEEGKEEEEDAAPEFAGEL